jgi:hypothetical protein
MSDEDVLDLQTRHAVAELLALDLVTVAQEIGGRGVVRERGEDLLREPDLHRGDGMAGTAAITLAFGAHPDPRIRTSCPP